MACMRERKKVGCCQDAHGDVERGAYRKADCHARHEHGNAEGWASPKRPPRESSHRHASAEPLRASLGVHACSFPEVQNRPLRPRAAAPPAPCCEVERGAGLAAAAGWGRAAGLGLRVLLPKRRGVEICEAWGARHCTYRAHLFVTVQFLHRRHVKGSPSLSKAAKMAFSSSLAVGSRFLRKRKRVFLTFHCDFENMEAGHTPRQ